MKFKILFLFFILSPVITFCQKKKISFDRVLNRLSHRTWIMKLCENGNCRTMDSSYYFFPTSFSELDKKTQCIHLLNYKYVRNEQADKIKLVQQLCNPIICFCDSSAFKNSYIVYANSDGGPFRRGNLTFISDSEFNCYPIYGHAMIFKSITPPKEVLSAIPR